VRVLAIRAPFRAVLFRAVPFRAALFRAALFSAVQISAFRSGREPPFAVRRHVTVPLSQVRARNARASAPTSGRDCQ
jgi:hypothetical protein